MDRIRDGGKQTAGQLTLDFHDAPLALADNTTFTVTSAASVLTVLNLLPAAGVSLTKSGGGTLAVNNVRTTAGISIAAGAVQVLPDGSAAGVSRVATLTISSGAKLDLTNNKLIVTSTPIGSFNGT